MLSMLPRLLVVLLILFGIHVLLYCTVIRFFDVKSRKIKLAMLLAVVLLSLSFLASRTAVHYELNAFTKFFFILSALWSGLVINLLPAMAISWAIAFAGWVAGRRPALGRIFMLFAAISFAFTAYGVHNAFNPRIKTVNVEIPNLPAIWEQKSIVFISDAHLGVIYTPEYFKGVARTINALNPDVIFITGDLFDGMSTTDLPSFIGPLNELKAKNGVFYVNGNHENYIGIGNVLNVLAKTKLKVLHDDVVELDGVRIIGVEYPQAGFTRDVKKVILSRKDNRMELPAILLYHTPTNIDQKAMSLAELQSRTYWTPDVDFSAAKELGVNLQLSGHTHSGQFIPFVYLARYLYKGYDYGLHIDGDFSIYTTSGLGAFGPPMRIGTGSEIIKLRLYKKTLKDHADEQPSKQYGARGNVNR